MTSARCCGNAEALRGPALDAVDELVATSYLRRQRRATFRDVRSALAWLITGDRSCEDVHEAREQGMDLRRGRRRPRGGPRLRLALCGLPGAGMGRPRPGELRGTGRRAGGPRRPAHQRRSGAVQRPGPRAGPTAAVLRHLAARRLGRESVRAYRYLGVFEEALLDAAAERLDGHLAPTAARAEPDARGPRVRRLRPRGGEPRARGDWPGPTAPGRCSRRSPRRSSRWRGWNTSQYVEWRPGHAPAPPQPTGTSLILTLDTFELVLRVADGDLIGDSADAAVRQEIETFGAALRRSPARSVRVVNPAGTARHARSPPTGASSWSGHDHHHPEAPAQPSSSPS